MIVPRSTAPWKFLSTPSARRATIQIDRDEVSRVISIHALREEGDGEIYRIEMDLLDFYPLTPLGGRPSLLEIELFSLSFLSTPSARRATSFVELLLNFFVISIHALREEGDSKNRDKISIFL